MAIKLTPNTPQQQALPSAAFGVPGSIKGAGAGFDKLSEFATERAEARTKYLKDKKDAELEVLVSRGLTGYNTDLANYKSIIDEGIFDPKQVEAAELKLQSYTNIETWLGPDATQKYSFSDFNNIEKFRTWRQKYGSDIIEAETKYSTKKNTRDSINNSVERGAQMRQTTSSQNVQPNLAYFTQKMIDDPLYLGNEVANNGKFSEYVKGTLFDIILDSDDLTDIQLIEDQFDEAMRDRRFNTVIKPEVATAIRTKIEERKKALNEEPTQREVLNKRLDAFPEVRVGDATDDEIIEDAFKLSEFVQGIDLTQYNQLNKEQIQAAQLKIEQASTYAALFTPTESEVVGPMTEPILGHSILFDATARFYGASGATVYNSVDVTSILKSIGIENPEEALGENYDRVVDYVQRTQKYFNDAYQYGNFRTLINHTNPDAAYAINDAEQEAAKVLAGQPYDPRKFELAQQSFKTALDDLLYEEITGAPKYFTSTKIDRKLAEASFLIFPGSMDFEKASQIQSIDGQLDWVKAMHIVNSPESIAREQYFAESLLRDPSPEEAGLRLAMMYSQGSQALAEQHIKMLSNMPDATEQNGIQFIKFRTELDKLRRWGGVESGWYENPYEKHAEYYAGMDSSYMSQVMDYAATAFEYQQYINKLAGNGDAATAVKSRGESVFQALGLAIRSEVHDETFVIPPEALTYEDGRFITQLSAPVENRFFAKRLYPTLVTPFAGVPQQQSVQYYEAALTGTIAKELSNFARTKFNLEDQKDHLMKFLDEGQFSELTKLMADVRRDEADEVSIRQALRSLKNREGEQLFRIKRVGDENVLFVKAPGGQLRPFTYLDENNQFQRISTPVDNTIKVYRGIIAKSFTFRENGFLGQFYEQPFYSTAGQVAQFGNEILDTLSRFFDADASFEADMLLNDVFEDQNRPTYTQPSPTSKKILSMAEELKKSKDNK